MVKKKKDTVKFRLTVGPTLYSRQGEEQGVLLFDAGTDEVIAWFDENANRFVSADTLARWAKQAQVYGKLVKKGKKT